MIGQLTGIVIESKPPQLMLDVSGVGYELSAPITTFYQLPELGGKITLYTQLVVREDSQTLYGFARQRDKSLFQTLIKANGVGPKLALAIMSGMGTDDFVSCIHAGDSTTLVRIPGIGKKTAERLVIDLADRLKDWQYACLGEKGEGTFSERPDEQGKSRSAAESGPVDLGLGEPIKGTSSPSLMAQQQQLRKDAEQALVALGYRPQEAAKSVKAVLSGEAGQLSREDVIKLALQSMLKRTVSA